MNKEKIVVAASEIINVQSDSLNYLEESFEFIRYRNITRKSEIEHLLDSVLSMFQTNETLDLYTRICLYYHAIDKESAMEYAQFYLEIHDDDSIIRKIIDVEEKMRRVRKYGKI